MKKKMIAILLNVLVGVTAQAETLVCHNTETNEEITIDTASFFGGRAPDTYASIIVEELPAPLYGSFTLKESETPRLYGYHNLNVKTSLTYPSPPTRVEQTRYEANVYLVGKLSEGSWSGHAEISQGKGWDFGFDYGVEPESETVFLECETLE